MESLRWLPALVLVFELTKGIYAQPPNFASPSYSVQVQETTTKTVMGVASPRPPNGFLTVKCTNRFNSSVNITYIIGEVNGSFPFVLNSTTGYFLVTQDLIYASQPRSYSFSVWCYDNLSPNLSSNASVNITVIEVDKYPPTVSPQYIFLTVTETTPVGTVMVSTRTDVGALRVYTASDLDVGPQGVLSYTYKNPEPPFSLNGTSGSLTLVQYLNLDFVGATSFYNPRIDVCDPYICTTLTVYMTVAGQNEYYPMFSQKVYSVTYNDSTPPGQVINSTCTDQDRGIGALQGVVFVNTTPGVFILNTSTGALTTNITMDYRKAKGYIAVLLCRDTGGLTNTTTVYVSINPPPNYNNPFRFQIPITSNESYEIEYSFPVSRTTPAHYIIGQIVASDELAWSTSLTYGLQNNPYFIIDGLTGVIQIISSVLNYPSSEIVLNATVTDGVYNGSVTVYMILTPGNLNSPVFTQGDRSFDISESLPKGTTIATFQCTDADSGTNGQISYSITGGNIDGAFRIDNVTGVVQVASYLTLDNNVTIGTYHLTIQCSDHGVPILSDTTTAYFNVYQDSYALPNFTSGLITAYVKENANINDTVITINVTDQFPLKYSFNNESVPNAFTIDSNTGVVRVATHLSHNLVPVYTMTVIATEIRSIGQAKNSSALLTIYVRDVNDNAPQCTMSSFTATILDTTATGSTVLQLSCSDADSGFNGEIVYSLSMSYGVLGIENSTGRIYLSNLLSNISSNVLIFTVLLSDRGFPPMSNSYPIIIYITVTIHDPPYFTNLPASLNLTDSTQIGTIFFTAASIDPNKGTSGLVRYGITPGLGTSAFEIFPNSGGIFLTQLLDYYSTSNYTLNITVSNAVFTMTSTLTITVVSTNQYFPVCQDSVYIANVPENTTVLSVLTNLSCSDANKGPNAQLVYRIASGNSDGKFSVSSNGLITLVRSLKYANATQYQLVINVTDSFPIPKAISVTVYVYVQPVNLYAPVFKQSLYNQTIPENAPIGTSILMVTATDDDGLGSPGGQISYSLIGQNQLTFYIDRSGLIQLASSLDIIQHAVYNFTVLATDGGSPPKTGSTLVVINVGYVATRPPQFSQNLYYTSLNITTPPAVGSSVLTVHCSDPVLGDNAPIQYSLNRSLSSSQYFNVDSNSGVITIKATPPSTAGTLVFQAICTGSSPYNLSDVAVVGVELVIKSNITFVQEDSCSFMSPRTYSCVLTESISPVYTILQVNATSLGGYTIMYSLITEQTTFSIDPFSGYFRLIGFLDYEKTQSYIASIQASVVSPLGQESTLANVIIQVINVNDEVPVITTPVTVTSVPENTPGSTVIANFTCTDADLGVYGQTHFSIIGGNAGNTFAISPSGQLQVNGSIDYKVTQIYNLILLCTDGGSPALSSNITVPIIVIPLNKHSPTFNTSIYTFSISEGLVPSSLVGTPLAATDSDSPPYNSLWYTILSGNTVPPTFTIDPTLGQLILLRSLDYRANSSYQLVVQVQDGGGLSNPGYTVLIATATVNIRIIPANLHTPQLSQSVYSGTIQLNTDNIGDVVLGVNILCTDQDSGPGGQTSLSITGGNVGSVFNISQSGYIRVQNTLLSSQAYPSYLLMVTCQDMGSPVLSSNAFVIVAVTGGNLFGPQFSQPIYNFTIFDNTTVGTLIGVVNATNPNSNIGGSITYAHNTTGSVVTVDSMNGKVYVTHTLRSGVYTYSVDATNTLGQNNTATLVLIVISANRALPYFSEFEYFASVSEHAVPPAVVIKLNCTTPGDGTSTNPYKYPFNTTMVPFHIDPVSGLVTVSGTLNASVESVYLLDVTCRDLDGKTSSAVLYVSILPYNHYPPVFTGLPYFANVTEWAGIGTPVYTVSATDADVAPYNTITFSITANNSQGVFGINPNSGRVYVSGVIDYQVQSVYALNIRAQNVIQPGDVSGSLPLSTDTILIVTVLSANDHYPVLLPQNQKFFYGNGSVAPGTVIATFTCTDKDPGLNGVTSFSILPNISTLAIYPNGSLIATGRITSSLSVEVICTDMGSPPHSNTTQVAIFTYSNNTYPPVFSSTSFYASVSGDTATVGQIIGCYQATDQDGPSTPDGTVTYTLDKLYSNDSVNRFGVQFATGCVFVALPLAPTTPFYQYLLKATDQGSPAMSGSATLVINVAFTVQSPRFLNGPYALSVSEDIVAGAGVVSVLCVDNRPNSTFVYSITGGNSDGSFAINNSGLIFITSVGLDYGVTTFYTLRVNCTGSTGLITTTSVYVGVIQVNKFTPTFVPMVVSILENTTVSTSVVKLNWTDKDVGLYGEVTFAIIAGNDKNAFSITSDGVVILIGHLDQSVYVLEITITDMSPTNQRSSTNNITILVIDLNDNSPIFSQNLYVFQLQGIETAGYVIGTVNCTDKDSTAVNSQVTYRIASATSNQSLFTLGLKNGSLSLTAAISNVHTPKEITLTVVCMDTGTPSLSSSALVLISVNETNHYGPQFINQSYAAVVSETAHVLTAILTVQAMDMDTGLYGMIHYSLQDTIGGTFYMDDASGQLMLLRTLSYATASQYFLIAVATDGAPGVLYRKTATANITVQVLPANRYDPCCPLATYSTQINQSKTGAILNFGCYDNDTGLNGMLVYTIVSGNINGVFTITNGSLTVPSAVPPNANITQYNIMIQVKDMGIPSRQTQVQVTVFYLFSNNKSPQFGNASYYLSVAEDTPVGTPVYAVKATDTDLGVVGVVRYSISGTDKFLIDAVSGTIFVSKALDWKTARNLSFFVAAQDQDPLTPRSSSSSVVVNILNRNVSPPSCPTTFVNAVALSTSPLNAPIVNVSCVDPDGSPFTYQLINGGGSSFGINSTTGTVYVAGPLMHSVSNLLTVNASDGMNRPTQVFVSIKVLFINQYPPQFTTNNFTFAVPETASLLTKVVTVVATDKDSANSSLTYKMNASVPFFIDTSNGNIFLVSPLDYEVKQSYTFTVQVYDSGSYDGSNKMSAVTTVTVAVINVNEYAPQFSNGGIFGTAVLRNTTIGTTVLSIECSDADLPPYGNATISSSGFKGTPFNLTQNRVILSQSPIAGRSYIILLTCTDNGTRSTNGTLFITVPDPIAPVFTQSPSVYLWTLPENASTGAVYAQVRALSSDQSAVNYSITYGNADASFYINARTGDIILVQQLSYATQQNYALIVQAQDGSNRQSNALVHVQVIQGQGQVPHPSALLSVDQGYPVGYPFGTLKCPDSTILGSSGSQSMFSFLNAPASALFTADRYGLVTTQAIVDSTPVYASLLTCYHLEKPELTGTGTATIQVSFANNYAPQFALRSYDVAVMENIAILSNVTTVSALDMDVGSYGQLNYSIVAGNPNKFTIDPATGEIKVLTSLDYESQDIYNLTVAAIDGGAAAILSQRKTGTTSVVIKVQNSNDNAPIPDQPIYLQAILTNVSALGNPVLSVHCSDQDLGSSVSYSLAPPSQDFIIQSNGSILLARNQSQQNIYTFSAVCADGSGLSSSAQVTVAVNLADVGYPTFTQQLYTATIPESQLVSSSILRVQATFTDSSVGITYAITNGNDGSFTIDAATGDIIVKAQLDAETQRYYVLSVQAVTTSCIPKTAVTIVQITVTDVNEYHPSFTKDAQVVYILESLPPPVYVAKVTCIDGDITSNIRYQMSVASGNGIPTMFGISSEGVIFTSNPLDYENQISYTLQVVCSDGGSTPKSASTTVGIQVEPVNEYIPSFNQTVYQFNVTENTPAVSPGHVTAIDLDYGIQGQVTYIALDPGNSSVVFVDPSTGILTITRSLNYEAQSSWNISIIARDGGGLENYTTVIINVINTDDELPVLTPLFSFQTIPNGAPYGYPVQTYSCVDPDGGKTNLTIVSGNSQQLFVLNEKNQLLWGGSQRSFPILSLILACTKTSSPSLSAYSYVAITNAAINATGFHFSSTDYQVQVLENTTIGSVVATVVASPGDGIRYSLLTSLTPLPFAVNETTGNITLTGMLNSQTASFYSFLVNASNSNGDLSVSLVEITVIAVNTKAPSISSSQNITLFRNRPLAPVTFFSCYDSSSGFSTSAHFDILSADVNNTFTINSNGVVNQVASLLTVMQSDITLTIACTINSRSSPPTKLFIHIIDTNVFIPMFDSQSYYFNVSEAEPIETAIGRVNASSRSGGLIAYAITAGNNEGKFQMDTLVGTIKLLSLLNSALTPNYTLTVTATDQTVYNNIQSATAKVYINVLYSNSLNPVLRPVGIVVMVNEYSLPTTPIISFTCSDPYGGKVNFTMSPQTLLFTISSTGAVQLLQQVAYETSPSYTFNVTCSSVSSGAGTSVTRATTSTLIVNIKPVNRFAPVVSGTEATILEDQTPFSLIGNVKATDMDNRGFLTYDISPPSSIFFIDRSNGDVYTRTTPIPGVKNYTLTIVVSDNDYIAGPRTGTGTLVVYVTSGSQPQFVPPDVLSFEVYIQVGTLPRTQLNVTAVSPNNVRTQSSSIQYIDDGVVRPVGLTLVHLQGSHKLQLINNLLITTAAIDTSDNNATYSLSLYSKYFNVTRNLVVIVTEEGTPPGSSSGLPLAVIITIVVMSSVLFLALFLCIVSFTCFCGKRYNRGKNALKNRNRLTHVGQRLRPETDEKKLFRYDDYDEIELMPVDLGQAYPYPYGDDSYNGFGGEGDLEGNTAFGMDTFGGEDIYAPSTDISALSSEHVNSSEPAEDANPSRFYSFGPILQAMIDEWRMGEEILSKEKSKQSNKQ